MRARLTTTLAFAALAFAGASEQAAACSCVGQRDPLSLRKWDGAITARLLDVDRDSSQTGRATYSYKVRRVFKGRHEYGLRRGLRLRITSYIGSASCGLPRNRHELYGLLMYEHRGDLQANLCTVTSPGALRDAADRRGPERALANAPTDPVRSCQQRPRVQRQAS